MFCRWNTIYTIFPTVFWMKYLRFRRLTFAVTSRSCLILEIFGSTDLHCCCLGSQFGGPVSSKSHALMLLFCLVWLRWRWMNLWSEYCYWRQIHETFHGFSDAEILAAGGTIRDPTPSLYPPRYAPLQWPPSNSHPGDLGSEERQILHVNSLPGQGQPVKPPSSYKTENLPQKNTLCQEKNSFLNFHWRLGIVFIMSVYCIMVTKCHKVTC